MANLNSVLNERISRIARKQIKTDTGTARRLTVQHRKDIAALKRQVSALQKAVAFLERQEKRRVAVAPVTTKALEGVRFRADGLRSHRKRLGLSAEDYGRLVGAAGLSIYNWELGKSRPRSEYVAKLVAVRGIGKREAHKRLEMLK
jgi:DNA-binding transcriptional regulator YiaG